MWVVIGALLVALYSLFQGSSSREAGNELTYSDFIAQVESGQVKAVTIQGSTLRGQLQNGRVFRVNKPDDPQLVAGGGGNRFPQVFAVGGEFQEDAIGDERLARG